MSRFYVGQRVRWVRNLVDAPTRVKTGEEGVVVELGCFPGLVSGVPYEVRVRDLRGHVFRAMFAELEPLTPPKQQEVVSWESMPCNCNGIYREGIVA